MQSLHDFDRFYEVSMQPEKALMLYLQALTICEQQLSPDHPRSVASRTRAIHLLRANGRTEEAAALESASLHNGMTSDQTSGN